MIYYGNAFYYDKKSTFDTCLMYCENCDLFKREISELNLQNHLYAASYANLNNEVKILKQREDFFNNILKLLKIELFYFKGEKIKLLDFGSAYGHFLEIAQTKGFNAVGVEINNYLQEHSISKGLTVFNNIEDFIGKVQVITSIDSLYYVTEPLKFLKMLEKVLMDNGILCIRVTNRNWLLKAKKHILRSDKFGNLLGDATVGFSFKSLSLLLHKAGFNIHKVLLYERGKRIGLKRNLFYGISSFFSYMFAPKIIISPGIVVIAKKKVS